VAESDSRLESRLRNLRHDLSNPLSAVLAEAQLLLLNQEQLTAETVESLKQIESLARKMRQILQDQTE
jgi:signal transduction histidine kinase